MKSQTILSGIRPSGILHIGNYLGAIKQWVELQKKYKIFAMIADLHAITTPIEPIALQEDTLSTAMFYLACGIDPKESTIFVQSHIVEHTQLAWILNTLTPIGELERMTQFKEKREEAGTLAGLLNYPVLQAADVLLYQTDVVPIGDDQTQHLEFTRTLARKFNNRYGKTLKEPKALVEKRTGRIMALDDPTKKMSKSAANKNSFISLLDSPDVIKKKIQSAVTDSEKEIRYAEKEKPAVSNLIAIYNAFSKLATEKIEDQYAGKSYAEFKKDLADLLVEKLTPIQDSYNELSKNKKEVLSVLQKGAEEASLVAHQTLLEAKKKVGFVI